MSEVKKIKSGQVELLCTVDGDKWKEAIKKAYKKLASNLDIKGFRKGQAPESMIKKYLPDERVQYQAAEDIAQDALIEGVKDNNVELIDRPELKIEEINADKIVFNFTCPVKPDVKLGNYKNLGYKVEDVSVTDGDIEAELDKLKELVKGSLVTLTGQTGAGKSTLLNKLKPELNIATQDISEALGRGKHTTRHTEIYDFEDFSIVDTPGFSALDVDVEKENIRFAFIEFDNASCKFNDCMHNNEKGCAVKVQLENKDILESRYENYRKMVDEYEDISKYSKK